MINLRQLFCEHILAIGEPSTYRFYLEITDYCNRPEVIKRRGKYDFKYEEAKFICTYCGKEKTELIFRGIMNE